MLMLIGIGIGKSCFVDLSESALASIKTCTSVHLISSNYHQCELKCLEKYLDLSCSVELVSYSEIENFIQNCKRSSEDICLLMPGNPFCDNLFPSIATLCVQNDIVYKVICNTSYMNAIGNTGIQMYKIGETFFVDDAKKDVEHLLLVVTTNFRQNLNTLVIFNKIANKDIAQHTLQALMDIHSEKDSGIHLSKVVVLYRDEVDEMHFDFGAASDLLERSSKRYIEAMCICSELDCVEEEYLLKAKLYQEEKLRGSSSRIGRFHAIGLGLGKPEDITIKGRKLIQESDKVFLEGYTSIMIGGKDCLEKYHDKEITVADRDMVEQNSNDILNHLEKGRNVSFLVVGDPLGATTHTDIIIRALEKNAHVDIANNTSIINALGISGLKPSKFGGIVSIPFWSEVYKPTSFYDKILSNHEIGWHTLCLLDIQVKEQSAENLARGRKIYEKPRYMSPDVASSQILECKNIKEKAGGKFSVNECTKIITLSRIGTDSQDIEFSTLDEALDADFGPPLHSLIVVGKLDVDESHFVSLKT